MKLKQIFTLFLVTVALAACNNTPSAPAANRADNTEQGTPLSGKIAFVNNDTLINNYKLYKELSAKLESKSEKVSKELDSKSRSLQSRAAQFNDKINKGLITRAQAEEEQAVMFNNIWNNIVEYLSQYNESAGYDLILNQNSATNTVLIGNPSMDITMEIVEALNKKFDEDKAAGRLNDLLGQ